MFSDLASRSGFGAANRCSRVAILLNFCNSVSADRSRPPAFGHVVDVSLTAYVLERLGYRPAHGAKQKLSADRSGMAASRRGKTWEWCFRSRFFSILAGIIFLSNVLLKTLQNRRFSALASRSLVLELLQSCVAVILCFAPQCLQIAVGMAASRFIVAAAACVILLRFPAESRTSLSNGRVKRGGNGALAADFFQF